MPREGDRQGWADTRGRRKDDGGVEKGHQKAKAQRQRPELLRGTDIENNSLLNTSGSKMM